VKTTQLNKEDALLRCGSFPFAWIREWSRVYLGKTPQKLSPEEWIEARFFGKGEPVTELRFFNDVAVLIELEEKDEYIWRHAEIENARFGKELTKADILNYDLDGQAEIQTTILLDWKGEA